MNIWQFAGEHPFLAFILAWLTVALLEQIWKAPFRAISIWKNGWPPAHCDADGDPTKDEE